MRIWDSLEVPLTLFPLLPLSLGSSPAISLKILAKLSQFL